MTDPVDTDALRAKVNLNADSEAEFGRKVIILQRAALRAADEVDRLRVSDSNATQQRDQLATALRRSDNENDRLRAVIENAPHMDSCRMSYLSTYPNARCTCWKADALG